MSSAATPKYVAIASFNCINLISGFSNFFQFSEQVSNVGGYTSRIGDFLEAMDDLEKKRDDADDNDTDIEARPRRISEMSGDCIKFEDVTIFTPDGKQLLSSMEFLISSWLMV
jgi:ABC-type uncharacterized transport system fused permease/ATPase subunit